MPGCRRAGSEGGLCVEDWRRLPPQMQEELRGAYGHRLRYARELARAARWLAQHD